MRLKRLIFVLLTTFLLCVLYAAHITPAAAEGAPQTGDDRVKVYDGPGLWGYKAIATLPKGYAVVPLATFVDFTKIQFVDKTGATREGYIVSRRLVNVPAGLPALSVEQVPWQTVGVLARKVYEFKNTKDIGQYHSFGIISSKSAIRIAIQIEPGSLGIFQFSDSLAPTDKPYWQGRHMIQFGRQNDNYFWSIWDGHSDQGKFTWLNDFPDGISFMLLPAERNSVTLLNSAGQAVIGVDSSIGDFPNGIPAKRRIYVELIVMPHATFTLKQLAWQTIPSGRGR